MVQNSDEHSKLLGICVQGELQNYTPPSSQLSLEEGLRKIGHSMSLGNLILSVNSAMV